MSLFSSRPHSVLVVAAHPDDEVLGCGGTMALLSQRGYQVQTLILAEGITSREETRDVTSNKSEISALHRTAIEANKLLGVQETTLKSLPDNRMDSVDLIDIVKVVESEIDRVRPETILTHFAGDLNIDHRLTHSAVMTATRPQPGTQVKNILQFEVLSSTEWQDQSLYQFKPVFLQDISSTLDLKLDALRIYESEMRPWPHSRSVQNVEHLARFRGGSHGFNAAEAFMPSRLLSL